MQRVDELEIRLAHQDRTIEELNEAFATQWRAIDETIRKGRYQLGCDNAHPSRHDHSIDLCSAEPLHQLLIELLTIGVDPVVHHLAGNAKTFGAPLRTTPRVVHNQQPNPGW